MARILSPATSQDVKRVGDAVAKLREARDLLREAGCSQALARTMAAIKSADGALRHVHRRARA